MTQEARARGVVIAAAMLLPPATLAAMFALAELTGSPGNVWFAVVSWKTGLGALYYLLPVAIFLVLGARLFAVQKTVPVFSLAVAAISAGLVGWYFTTAWEYGLEYQGAFATIALAWANAVVFLVLALLGVLTRWRPSFATNLAFHWVFTVWLASGAFPYLGEVL